MFSDYLPSVDFDSIKIESKYLFDGLFLEDRDFLAVYNLTRNEMFIALNLPKASERYLLVEGVSVFILFPNSFLKDLDNNYIFSGSVGIENKVSIASGDCLIKSLQHKIQEYITSTASSLQ